MAFGLLHASCRLPEGQAFNIYIYIYIYVCFTLRSIKSSYSVIVPVKTSVDKICSLLKHLYTKNYCRIANNNFFFPVVK